MRKDIGLLALRVVSGGLMAGHGAQKLFGMFDGPGFEGTAGWLDSLELRPAKGWAATAGASELGGGLLTALGLLSPLGSLGTIAAMTVAIAKSHWGKPIWASEGGAELPLTNIAIATALWLTGPGKLSVDEALDIELPQWAVFLVALATAAGVVLAVRTGLLPGKEQGDAAEADTGEEEQPERSRGESNREMQVEFSTN